MADAPPPGFKAVEDVPPGFKPVDTAKSEGKPEEPVRYFDPFKPRPWSSLMHETLPQIGLTGLALAPAGAAAAAAGIPAVVGKMAAGGAIGAGRQAMDREGGLSPTLTGLLDAALIAVTEGGAGAAKKVLEGGLGKRAAKLGLGFGRAAKGFEAGTEKLKDALNAVSGRIGQYATLNIPSLSKQAMSLSEAFDKLLAARGATFKQALKEMKSELNALDLQSAPKPSAGQVFVDRAATFRKDPSGWSKLVRSLTPGATGETARTLAEAQAITPYHGVPAGAMEAQALADMTGSGFGGLARHVLPHMVP